MPRFGWSLVAVILVCVVSARAQILYPILNDSNHAGGAAFTGSGDAVSGAKGYYGVFAYTSALRGTKTFQLVNSPSLIDSGTPVDVVSDATTGIVSSTQTVNGLTCGTTFATNFCTVKILYDQTSSGIGNLTQTTVGFRALFVPNRNGTIPALCSIDGSGNIGGPNSDYNGGTFGTPTATTVAMSWQPLGTHSANERGMWQSGTGAGLLFGVNASTAAYMYNGAFDGSPITVTNSNWFAMIGTSVSGTSGTLDVNSSTDTTGLNGGITPTGTVGVFGDNGSGSAQGCSMEFRFDAVQLSSGNRSTLISNMRSSGRGNF